MTRRNNNRCEALVRMMTLSHKRFPKRSSKNIDGNTLNEYYNSESFYNDKAYCVFNNIERIIKISGIVLDEYFHLPQMEIIDPVETVLPIIPSSESVILNNPVETPDSIEKF